LGGLRTEPYPASLSSEEAGRLIKPAKLRRILYGRGLTATRGREKNEQTLKHRQDHLPGEEETQNHWEGGKWKDFTTDESNSSEGTC